MSDLMVLFALMVTWAAFAHSAHMSRAGDVTMSLESQRTGGFELVLNDGDERTVYAHIGRTLVSTYTWVDVEGGVEVKIGGVNLTINTLYDAENKARGIKIKWEADNSTRLEDCIDFGTKHWYAGPMQIDQVYPVENAQQTYAPYVTRETDNAAIVERYWLNSNGEYVYVHEEVPLFVDYGNILDNNICYGAQIFEPYSSRRNHTVLAYDIWFLPDAKAAHLHAVANYLGKPSDLPDFRMVEHPIWSTWAQYWYFINQTNLLEFANSIRAYGFNDSQFEIDDLWEDCYGSLTVDENKIPNFTELVQDIKDLGFRVTLWIHPFINSNCEVYNEARENGYLVVNEEGSAVANWWNPNGTEPGLVDFTNPEAAEWWYQRVKNLTDTYGVDSFKFDAGESSFSPQIPVQNGDIDTHPHHIVQDYVRTCARFGNMIEVRSGFRIFVRMVDRDSIWGLNNGLPTIITTTLQMNLDGYTFVLPDMIGGNGFNLNHEQADVPSKELFIRWVQANTFLPVMQYSYVPWNFDNETVEICKKYTELHAEFADEIYSAMQASVEHGTPVNAPIWWLDPLDEEAQVIWDEYLLGENILVAPVLVENSTSRDVYLPRGTWLVQGDPDRPVEGPTWLRNFPAPLHTLPYFVRDVPAKPDAAVASRVAVALIILGIMANLLN